MSKKGFSRKAWDFLGSRNLSVFIFIMGLVYTLFLVIFAMLVPVPWVNNIANLLPFQVLYFLFFINLIICEIKWVPIIIRRCRKPESPERGEDLGRFRCKVDVTGYGLQVTNLGKYLRHRGFRILQNKFMPQRETQIAKCKNNSTLNTQHSTLLYAYRGRFSPIGNLLFHIAFLFLLSGVMVSMFFRFEGSVRATEGFQFSGSKSEYTFISAAPMASLPSVSFLLDKITPSFWEDRLLFTDLRADVSYEKDVGSIWMSSPLSIGMANITLQGIGLTPMYLLKNKDGKELDSAYVNLAIFTSGSEDYFQVPGFPHRIFISFYPDHEIKGGKVINRSMNVNNPAYSVRVFRGRIPVYSGVLKPGEEAVFENLRLSFPEFRYWGNFRIIKDPGLIFIWIAFILFGIGLTWRLMFYRREIVVTKEGDNICLYCNSDYYGKLFQNSLMKLLEIN